MAEQFLSQEEVDALLDGGSGESPAAAAPGGVRPFDLAGGARPPRPRMPALEAVNERFARDLAAGLGRFLRRKAEVTVGAIQLLPFGQFLHQVPVPAGFNVLSVKPLHGHALLVVEPALVYAIVENLFGGCGRPARIEDRAFTATEQRIVQRLLEVVFAAHRSAWASLHPVTLGFERAESLPQFADIVPADELVAVTPITLEPADSGGTMHLVIPHAAFEPIRDLLSAARPAAGPPDRRWSDTLRHEVQAAPVEIAAVLGRVEATIGEVLQLSAGDFIELDQPRSVEARVNGVPLFWASFGISNDRYALKVERFVTPEPATPGGSHVH
jgi:flagellar motor switch protein FliM